MKDFIGPIFLFIVALVLLAVLKSKITEIVNIDVTTGHSSATTANASTFPFNLSGLIIGGILIWAVYIIVNQFRR